MPQHPLQQINFSAANQAFVIEASAGTGKTWTIERLYIKALLEASQIADGSRPIGVENILVVTFTNDATDELRQRIADQIQLTINQLIFYHNQPAASSESADLFLEYLLERLEQGDLRKDLTILTRALQNFAQAAIYTIHGFCKRVLEDYQFECATPAEFELVATKNAIIGQLILDFIRIRIINNPEFTSGVDIVLFNLDKLFSSGDAASPLWQRIANKIPQSLFTLEHGQYKLKFTSSVPPDLSKLTQSELTPAEQCQAKAEFLSVVMNYLAAEYPRLSQLSGCLSYDELIQKVADSLLISPQLATKLYQIFPVAFIDEFQDTDTQQWQIFSQIYQLTAANRGSVVVVGDPKQAIYRFRGADVDTYLEAREQIGARLELTANFRAHPQIMNFINELFFATNQPQNPGFLGREIEHIAVSAQTRNCLELPSVSRLNEIGAELGLAAQFYAEPVQLVSIMGATADERKRSLLAAVTGEILALLKVNPELKGKIAILVTKSREARELVRFMRKYGLKAAELKLGNVFATSCATDLYQILVAVNDLSQRANFMQALTSQILNLDLASLNPENNCEDSSENSLFEQLQRQFFVYRDIWQRHGIISLVYAILNDTLGNQRQVAGLWSNRELANLWQLAELLNKQAGYLHNQEELLHWFHTKISNAARNSETDIEGENEELIRLDNDDEQIIITTQHKAKGLEYDILFCPYFKSSIQLDGAYDFNYRRPFFSNHRVNGVARAELILDEGLARQVVDAEDKEAHRLNYVALTRAKSRVYIYLKQPTLSKSTGKYFSAQRPDKLVELFGWVKDDPADDTHPLFNYPIFFSPTPEQAIKRPDLLPGVRAYQRNFSPADLAQLSFQEQAADLSCTSLHQVAAIFKATRTFSRQSYSGLTSHEPTHAAEVSDYYVKAEVMPAEVPEYRYSILTDGQLRGAAFGTLFHELCENYPFSSEQLQHIMAQANLHNFAEDYASQLTHMLDEAFNYPLVGDMSLNQLPNSLHELEFNLTIATTLEMKNALADLIGEYFGLDHPFSLACRSLGRIESGFLVGFIDLFFELNGKYWVLDYKTNTLNDYTPAVSLSDNENPLIISMAEHHYYLQYLFYLVAIKRYLESGLGIPDASQLLGGSIYFYVRGVYLLNPPLNAGIYIDNACQELVRKIDTLFKG